jgi:hypothetical protein
VSVIPFRSKYAREHAKNLDDFIERARNELTLYEDQGGFQSLNWKHQYSNGKTVSMQFSAFAPVGKKIGPDMEQPYLDFARAYVREVQSLNAVNPAAFMVALKAIHEGLMTIHGRADILELDGPSVRVAVESLERLAEGAKYRAGQRLEMLLEWLKANRINITIPAWSNPWKRPHAVAEGTSDDDRKAQAERLLTDHQVACLADAFTLAKTTRDRFFSAQMVLLMCAPNRGGELHFLTTDCFIESHAIEKIFNKDSQLWEEKTTTVLNIRWKAEKGGGLIPKPVHPRIVHIVREAVQRLIDIGAEAREAAAWAIANPDKFYRHSGCITSADHGEDDPLTYAEFCAAFALAPTTTIQERLDSSDASIIIKQTPQKWCKDLCKGRAFLTYRNLAEYTVQKYKEKFPKWPNIAEVGMPVSEALCLIRENELHSEFAVKGYSWEVPDVNRLNNALGADMVRLKNGSSMFSSAGLTEQDGSHVVLSSHQVRSWLSTCAERSGMDSLDIAMFAGRVRIEDNHAYDLRPPEEREDMARHILDLKKNKSGGLQAIAAVKVNAPVTRQMLGDDRVGTVQHTPWGFCEFDWSMVPCTKAGNCSFCTDHACIKGLPDTLENQEELYASIKVEFERALVAYENGTVGTDRWVVYHGKRLATLGTILKILKDDNVPDGYVIRIPEELDPSRTQIALAENGFKTDLNASDPVAQNFIDNTQNLFLSILRGENEN